MVAECCDGLVVRLSPGQRPTTVPTVPRQGVFWPRGPECCSRRSGGQSLAGQQEAWPSPKWHGDKASSLFSAIREVGQSDVDVTSGLDFLKSTIPAIIVYFSTSLLLRVYNLNSNILKVCNPNSNFLYSSSSIP